MKVSLCGLEKDIIRTIGAKIPNRDVVIVGFTRRKAFNCFYIHNIKLRKDIEILIEYNKNTELLVKKQRRNYERCKVSEHRNFSLHWMSYRNSVLPHYSRHNRIQRLSQGGLSISRTQLLSDDVLVIFANSLYFNRLGGEMDNNSQQVVEDIMKEIQKLLNEHNTNSNDLRELLECYLYKAYQYGYISGLTDMKQCCDESLSNSLSLTIKQK
jgi:hypothetical protein